MGKKLYVGNLAWAISEKELRELFSKFGEIEEITLITDKFSKRSKGFGFVTFKDEADAERATKEMGGKEVEGRTLTVNEAKPMRSKDNRRR